MDSSGAVWQKKNKKQTRKDENSGRCAVWSLRWMGDIQREQMKPDSSGGKKSYFILKMCVCACVCLRPAGRGYFCVSRSGGQNRSSQTPVWWWFVWLEGGHVWFSFRHPAAPLGMRCGCNEVIWDTTRCWTTIHLSLCVSKRVGRVGRLQSFCFRLTTDTHTHAEAHQ